VVGTERNWNRGRHLAAALLVLAAIAAHGTPSAEARVALGAYIPGAERHPSRIDAYARKVGHAPLIVSTYKDWGNRPFEPEELDRVWRHGAVPMITWEPWGFPLRRIARGRYDRYVRAAARTAARWRHPIFLRFAHEMNGDWYPWGAATPAGVYKAAWRHLVRVFRQVGADNVRWVWTPHVDPHWALPFEGRYPGDRWVEWVGLDAINWGGASGWRSFKRLFGGSYRLLRRLSSAPVMLGEVGCGEAGGSKASWVSRAMRRVLPRMRRVRALLWWSKSDPRADLRIDSSGAALDALRSAARLPTYGTDRQTLLR
jgi:hypothetical protein